MLLVNLLLWMALAVLVSVATRVDYDDNFQKFPKIVTKNSKESKYAEVQDVISNDIQNDMNFKVKYVPWFKKSTKVLPLERQRTNFVKKFRTSTVDDIPKYIIEYVDGRLETYSQRPNDSPSATRSPVMYRNDEFLGILVDPEEDLSMATVPEENLFNFEANDDLNMFKDGVFTVKEDLKESLLPEMEKGQTYKDDNSEIVHYGIIKEILKLKTSSKELVNFGHYLNNLVISVASQNLREVYEGEQGPNTDYGNDESTARTNIFTGYSDGSKDYPNQDVPKIFGPWKQFLDKRDPEEDISYTKYEPHFFIVFPHGSKSSISSSGLGSNVESPDIRGTENLPSFVSVFEKHWGPLIHVKPAFQEAQLKTYLTIMEQLFAKAMKEMNAGCQGQLCLSTDDKVDSQPTPQDHARAQEANANMDSNEKINATVTAKSEEEPDFASSDGDESIMPKSTARIKTNLHFLLNGSFLVEEADQKVLDFQEDSERVPPGKIRLSASKEHITENEVTIDLASNDQSDSSITRKSEVRIAVALHFILNGGFMADLATSDTREAIPRVPEREIYPEESGSKAKSKKEPTATSNLTLNLDSHTLESEDYTDFIFEEPGNNSISQNNNMQVAVNLQIKLNGSVLSEVTDLLTSDIEEDIPRVPPEESHSNKVKPDSKDKTKIEYTGTFNFPSNLDSATAESEKERDFTSKDQSNDSIPQNSKVRVAVNLQFKFNGSVLQEVAELFTSGIQEDVLGVPQREVHHEEDESLSRDYEDYSWLFNYEEDVNRVEEKHTKNRIYQHPSTGIVYGVIHLKSPVSLDLEQPMNLYDIVEDLQGQDDEPRPRSVTDTILLSDFFGNLDNSHSPLSDLDSLARSLAGSYGWVWKNTGNGKSVYPRIVKFSSLDTQNSVNLDYEEMSLYGAKNAYSKLKERKVKHPSPTVKRRWHSGLAPDHLDEL